MILRVTSLFLLGVAASPLFAWQSGSTRHEEGLTENRPNAWVLQGARVVVRPGTSIDDATIVIRDGRIVSVRGSNDWPADHRVVDLSGKTVYAGLIDACSEQEITISETPQHTRYWNANIRPGRNVSELFAWKDGATDELKKHGITAVLVSPGAGIFKGSAALLLADDEQPGQSVIVSQAGQVAELTVQRRFGGPRIYPSSPMGAVALARQALYDATWYREAWQVASTQADVARPEFNLSLKALQPVLDGEQPLLVMTSNELMALRADRFAREFELKLIIVGNGNEYRRLQEIAALERPLILPVNFPAPPLVTTAEDAMNATLESLLHWDLAPENPARLADAGVEFAFTSKGLRNKSDFLKRIRQAVVRGLDPDKALASLTTVPARYFGAEDQIGTIETGKLANLLVTDGDLFDKKTKIVETWVAGRRHENEAAIRRQVGGAWTVTAGDGEPLVLNVKQNGTRLSGSIQRRTGQTTPEAAAGDEEPTEDGSAEDSSDATEDSSDATEDSSDATEDSSDATEDSSRNDDQAGEKDGGEQDEDDQDEDDSGKAKKSQSVKSLILVGARLSGSFKSADFGKPGTAQFTLIVAPDNASAEGYIVWPDGGRDALTAELTRPQDEGSDAGENADKTDDAESESESESEKTDPDRSASAGQRRRAGSGKGGSGKGSSADAARYSEEPSSYPVNYPLGAFGVAESPQPETVLFENVTVWTCGESGVLEGAAVLIQDGKIASIHKADDERPDCDRVIDGTGKHLTPGIIDCHSHFATDSGVNEGAQAITAEVRIGDFIDCDDITIYRQLAGGVTASNILHGSANPIGGQNQVVKLRWGLGDEALKMTEAPAGIKFALGENVKRSRSAGNPGATPRYPTSRMGVEQLMHDTFRAARQYRARHDAWNSDRQGLPPRRDLELDAIAEILDGKRWIHCHSYRQDEILALIRVLDEYEITIGTFQHILEGYKVAEKMAEHGAMASAFADWWAYKFEVYDAIPFAGKLMHDAGIVVSFNSDDGELATHLNQEAAKAVKYGGVPPQEALKFVTLNPARQLRIDQYVGSIEVGKHADLALWNGPPLSAYSRCEQTWIDGRKYFDVADDARRRGEVADMRQTLIQKILNSGETMRSDDSRQDDPQNLWPRYDEFCGSHINKNSDADMLQKLQQAWLEEEEDQELSKQN